MIAFCSLIPVVGAALMWVPAALWLLLSGEIGAPSSWRFGVLGISMADNVLRPLLLAGRTSASGLVVFLGLLGGAAAFGFIGLVFGPIVLVTAGNLLIVFTRSDLSTIVVAERIGGRGIGVVNDRTTETERRDRPRRTRRTTD